MELVSTSPSSVASVLWQPQPETWVLTVVFKATLQLRPGESLLAPEQEAPREDDRHWGENRAQSLHSPSDMAPMKPRADVLLVGKATAPGRRPVRSLVARLIAGHVDKSIEVFCDRTVLRDGSVSEGPMFTSMPLVYERAGGGPDTWNPVGLRLDVRDHYGNVVLPNLQPPGTTIQPHQSFIEPIGFGPIAAGWPSRREKLGRHAASWSPRDWNKKPFPPDLDPAYFNTAPPDQQTDTLRDDEQIVLDNLHPDFPRFITALPGVHPRAYVQRRGGAPAGVAMRCDTLWIDTDRWLCTLTWRGRVPLEHPREQGEVLVAMEKPGQALSAADVEQMLGRRRAPAFASLMAATAALPGQAFISETLDFSAGSGLAAELPFAPRAPAPPPEVRPLALPPRESSPWAAPTPIPLEEAPRPLIPEIGPARAASAPPDPSRGPWAAQAPAPSRAELVDARILVWFDPDHVPRIRRRAPWSQILEDCEQHPPDRDLDDAALDAEPVEVEDRRDVFEILARGEPLDAPGLDKALSASVRDDGKFVSPLVLVEGELIFAFDELAALKATVATVTPLAGGDENLKSALAAARDLLEMPDPVAAPAVPEGLVTRIKDCFAQAKRVVPAGYLEAQTERALLEKRCYQRRAVFGGPHLRALLQLPGGAPPVPSYLPGDLGPLLPMFQRFKARLIAELHLPVDQNETHPAALRVRALARVAPRR